MKRSYLIIAALIVTGLAAFGCATTGGGPWTTLIDGEKGLENFNRVGDANWRAEGGAIVADKGKGGHLVSKQSYGNFEMRVEFYAETNSQSGIFIRVQDPNKITATNAYEVNIYDTRPGQEYATGSIVNFGRIPVPNPPAYRAGGKWNTFLITAKDTHLKVVFNGIETVTIYDSQFASGPFTLQFGNRGKEPGDVIKFRKLEVRPL
jgi:hypothetical protein